MMRCCVDVLLFKSSRDEKKFSQKMNEKKNFIMNLTHYNNNIFECGASGMAPRYAKGR